MKISTTNVVFSPCSLTCNSGCMSGQLLWLPSLECTENKMWKSKKLPQSESGCQLSTSSNTGHGQYRIFFFQSIKIKTFNHCQEHNLHTTYPSPWVYLIYVSLSVIISPDPHGRNYFLPFTHTIMQPLTNHWTFRSQIHTRRSSEMEWLFFWHCFFMFHSCNLFGFWSS